MVDVAKGMILSLVFLPLVAVIFLPALFSGWYDEHLETFLSWLGTGGALASWALIVAVVLNAIDRRGPAHDSDELLRHWPFDS